MTTVVLSPLGAGQQFFGGNTAASSPNVPLSAGLLYIYQAGTTTPVTTYTTSAGTIANTNPIVLQSDGRPPYEIWWIPGFSYKMVLQDSQGNPIPNGTWDNLVGINDLTTSGLALEGSSLTVTGNSSIGGNNAVAGNETIGGALSVTGAVNGVLIESSAAGTNTNYGPVTTVEMYMGLPLQIPANTIGSNQHYRIKVWGVCTSSAANTVHLNVRCGPNGTTADTALGALTLTSATTGTNIPFILDFDIFSATTGSSGTFTVYGWLFNQGTTGINSGSGEIGSGGGTVNTTINNQLGISIVNSAGTTSITSNIVLVEMVR